MMALEVERQKADNQANDTQVDAEVDKYKTDVAAQVDKYKADLNAELQVLLAQLKTGGTVDTERVKAALRDAPILDANKSIESTGQAVQSLNQQLAQSIAEITSVVQELKDASDSPREVVRDEKGKVTGVKVNGKTRPIQRDADGKVIGV
jgi:chromosome segregation ATPase